MRKPITINTENKLSIHFIKLNSVRDSDHREPYKYNRQAFKYQSESQMSQTRTERKIIQRQNRWDLNGTTKRLRRAPVKEAGSLWESLTRVTANLRGISPFIASLYRHACLLNQIHFQP